ncbi:hypothetical protein SAMN03080599_02060 [Acidaminobacter hydrogenoformans DSM 2784]|uniref:Uncharacterized protein n=1 Tax=Acidaminobacter hydrogenoformans DSM 2784 TaxID=1120920 RepID=A0A1G5S0S0_9FIRM|nr:hypothetical protein SAMN03080599_02060 [Acidaminobacter hydrogenoformans DSM 2784]
MLKSRFLNLDDKFNAHKNRLLIALYRAKKRRFFYGLNQRCVPVPNGASLSPPECCEENAGMGPSAKIFAF